MLKVGITGTMGSGKTTVCKIFELLGNPVFNSDECGKFLLDNRNGLKKKIRKIFGNECYGKDGKLNRKVLAEKVFNDKTLLHQLNTIVHPLIRIEFRRWFEKINQKKNKPPFVIEEAALMFESGAYKQMDKVICVTCPEKIRLKRLMKRNTRSDVQEFRKRMKNQYSERKKVSLSDYIICNNENKSVIEQVMELLSVLGGNKKTPN